ncbi:Restriction endonuclease S subunit (HsdS) [Fructobacillus cardui]|nr:Restriction endonuclease S subunit (HsdS) [Fructobacillus cardui]
MNTLPALTAGILNQGLNNYVPEAGATVFKNVISVSANGANTGAMFYQTHPFTVLQDAYVIDLIDESKPSDMVYLYLVGALQKSIRFNFSWTNKAGWERIKGEKITLPVDKNGLLAFDYMEAYIKELEAERIKELEAYLIATGLNNYVLNDEEKRVLNKFRAHNAEQSRAEQSRAEQSRAEQSRAEQSRAEQ